MRVIGGKYKGKKIDLPVDKNTRPLKDLVKESIFNIFKHSKKFHVDIAQSTIVDIFSGTGSFGIECFSRGARKVIFFENYSRAIKILKNNLSRICSEDDFEIIDTNCFEYFKNYKIINSKNNLIFLDPPFQEKNINNLIYNIKKQKILDENGLIVIHRHKNDKIDVAENLNILDTRYYGLSKIIFAN